MGLVSKEIVRFWIPPCTMPCLVLMRRGNRPLNQLTALLGFEEVSVTALKTSSGLVQRSCNSVLLLFISDMWGGQRCCSCMLFYLSKSNWWGAWCCWLLLLDIILFTAFNACLMCMCLTNAMKSNIYRIHIESDDVKHIFFSRLSSRIYWGLWIRATSLG